MDTISQLLASQGLSRKRLNEVRELSELPTLGKQPRNVEHVGVKGHLKILGIANDKVWVACDKDNIITDVGFALLAAMWGGPVSPDTYLTLRPNRIAVGTGAYTSPTGSITKLDMGVGGALPTYISTLTQISFTGATTITGVKFELLIPNGTPSDPYNVGTPTLTEAGLFAHDYSGSTTGNGGMISYRSYDPITKSEDFSLLYQWSFVFAEA